MAQSAWATNSWYHFSICCWRYFQPLRSFSKKLPGRRSIQSFRDWMSSRPHETHEIIAGEKWSVPLHRGQTSKCCKDLMSSLSETVIATHSSRLRPDNFYASSNGCNLLSFHFLTTTVGFNRSDQNGDFVTGITVLEFLLAQFLSRQAVQKSNRRQHISRDFNANICRWKDLFKQALRGDMGESPVPALTPTIVVGLAYAWKSC